MNASVFVFTARTTDDGERLSDRHCQIEAHRDAAGVWTGSVAPVDAIGPVVPLKPEALAALLDALDATGTAPSAERHRNG